MTKELFVDLMSYDYYIKVVPTRLSTGVASTLSTYQYAVTHLVSDRTFARLHDRFCCSNVAYHTLKALMASQAFACTMNSLH